MRRAPQALALCISRFGRDSIHDDGYHREQYRVGEDVERDQNPDRHAMEDQLRQGLQAVVDEARNDKCDKESHVYALTFGGYLPASSLHEIPGHNQDYEHSHDREADDDP